MSQGLRVRGFNARRWMAAHPREAEAALGAIAKLVDGGKLRVAFAEYFCPGEFRDALEHALEGGRNSKVLLRFH